MQSNRPNDDLQPVILIHTELMILVVRDKASFSWCPPRQLQQKLPFLPPTTLPRCPGPSGG